MTPIDDLHVNQWIAIVAIKEEEQDEPSPFGFMSYGPRTPEFDGRPMQIKAISLPYLAVQSGGHRFSIDIRKYSVKLLHRTYVRALNPKHFDAQSGIVEVADVEADEAKQETSGGEGCCPICNDRLVERRVGNGLWMLVCRECGFTGGRPPQEVGE